MKAIRPAANMAPANALSRVAPLVALGLGELEVVGPVADGSETAVEETDEADRVAERDDSAVEIEAVVLVPEAEVEAEDAFLTSMVKEVSPPYICTVRLPDVVVVRSSLGMV